MRESCFERPTSGCRSSLSLTPLHSHQARPRPRPRRHRGARARDRRPPPGAAAQADRHGQEHARVRGLHCGCAEVRMRNCEWRAPMERKLGLAALLSFSLPASRPGTGGRGRGMDGCLGGVGRVARRARVGAEKEKSKGAGGEKSMRAARSRFLSLSLSLHPLLQGQAPRPPRRPRPRRPNDPGHPPGLLQARLRRPGPQVAPHAARVGPGGRGWGGGGGGHATPVVLGGEGEGAGAAGDDAGGASDALVSPGTKRGASARTPATAGRRKQGRTQGGRGGGGVEGGAPSSAAATTPATAAAAAAGGKTIFDGFEETEDWTLVAKPAAE